MYLTVLWLTLFGLAFGAPKPKSDGKTTEINFLMNNVQPTVKDTYLCTPMKMNSTPTYIVGFKPHANMKIAHHMLLYGCSTPGRNAEVWNCGEMAHVTSKYDSAGVCGSGSQIVYAWAMDAPSLTLPPDVAFKVGGNSKIKYLVLQVHYKDVSSFLPPQNGHDSSGITLVTTDHPMPKTAGVYLMGTAGSIPAHSIEYMETECQYNGRQELHPFAFRTHTHTHGEVVSGYRIRDGKWTEIGRMSPKKPQMFYNATTQDLVIKSGDILAARCTMRNDGDKKVYIGATQNDEMCNFYMMYYVNGEDVYQDGGCWASGPPYNYWQTSKDAQKMHLENAPKTVSIVPGTQNVLTKQHGRMKSVRNEDNFLERLDSWKLQTRKNDVRRLLETLNRAYDEPAYGLYDNNVF